MNHDNERSNTQMTDAELALVQGGGFGSWIKGAVKSVGNAIGSAVDTVVDLVTGKKLLDIIRKRPGPFPLPFPRY